LILAGLVRWTSITWASQGRLIFPAISALSVLMVAGLSALWRGLPAVLAVFLAGVAAVTPCAVIAPHYAPPAELSAAQLAAIPQRLDADFGGELKLLGYDLRTEAAEPGGTVRLTLYWQSQIAMDRNWSLFVHLVDEDEIIVAQRDRYPGQGLLATTLLRPGQTWADDYVIALPAGAFSPARLKVRVGVYDLRDGARLRTAAGAEWVDFGQIALAGREVTTRLGPVPNALRQNLGGLIELTGYAVDRRVLRAGEPLTLTLYWRALAPIAGNYSISARVRGEDLTRWAAQDAWPQAGAAPTSSWRLGETFADPYTLTLDPATPPGQYFLEVLVYDPETLAPLRLWEAGDRPTDGGSVLLGRVRVTP
ncbi:MAG: hypothetical protein KA764_20750, partial [Anaerolineales bacterium]|nr:hypothetical protein [Anaerolineales bacterium]